MVQPVNYTSSFGNIGDTLTKGYSLGSKMREDIVKRKLIETQQARQNEANQGLIDLSNNLSADNAQKFMVRFPEYSEKLKGVFDGMQQTEKDEIKMEAAQTANLLENGTPEMAKAYLLEKEEAYRNKGDNQRADSYRKMAEMAEAHPNLIKTQAFNTVWQLGGKDAVESMIKLRKSDSEIKGLGLDNELKQEDLDIKRAEAPIDKEIKEEDLKKKKKDTQLVQAQIDKLFNDIGIDSVKAKDLPTLAQGKLFDISEKESKSTIILDKAKSLQDKMKSGVEGGQGIVGTVKTYLKQITGNEDAYESFKQEFSQITTSEMMEMLPPGAASDKDIAAAREGFPKPDASADTIENYLNMVVKYQSYNKARANVEAHFVSENKHPGKAKEEFEINGIKVKKGETLQNFMDRAKGDIYKGMSQGISEKPITSESLLEEFAD
jgi:hypothetical protein